VSGLPETYAPQLATLVKAPPSGREWVHEIKYDGYRIGCRIDRRTVTLLSRRGLDWTDRLPEIHDAAAALGVRAALLDGEVAIVRPDGRTSFQALQNAFGGGDRGHLVYFAFDLLFLNGDDLTALPLSERKARLARVLASPPPRIRFSEHFDEEGADVLRRACGLELEGIVSKRRDEPYHAGRHPSWVKTKCVSRQEFVIGGFTDPEGKRQGLGALLVGYYEGPNLRFAGKVGTGFTDRGARELRGRLDAIEQSSPPFTPRPPGWLGRHAHWAQPVLVAEIVFTEWTEDGKIRHPSFQGIRMDKRAEEVRRETPVAAAASPPPAAKRRSQAGGTKNPPRQRVSSPAAAASPSPKGRSRTGTAAEIAGVRITHPERVIFQESGLTKLGLAEYYEQIADWILPHLRGRPLTLVRCPDGAGTTCFYMKHSKAWAPDPIRRVNIREKTKIGEYLIVDTLPALIGLVQMNVLEIHTWNSRFDHVEQPDRIVFDIDPGPRVAWPRVIEAARLVRTVLQTLELASFLKTTGGRGLHVVVPLQPRADWGESLEFSRLVAEAIVRTDPERYTTAFAKAGREEKILIDYLRNNRTNTSVAAFSTRARPTGTVSVPLRWEELSSRVRSDHFTVRAVRTRLARLPADPWAEYWTLQQRLSGSARKALAALG
jgi:bifunctional non-homologous end joining protein LigD